MNNQRSEHRDEHDKNLEQTKRKHWPLWLKIIVWLLIMGVIRFIIIGIMALTG